MIRLANACRKYGSCRFAGTARVLKEGGNMPYSLPVREDFIQALLSLVGQGIRENQLDDAELVLEALKILSPTLPNIDEFVPYIAIKRGFPKDALQMYVASPSDDSRWYAMMGLCLKLADDPTWHWHASQALEKQDSTSACAHDLAKVLLGHEDVSTDAAPAVISGARCVPADSASTGSSLDYLHYRTV